MRRSFVLLLLCFPSLLLAQGWQRYYSGSRAFSLQHLPDGSLVIAGHTVNTGGQTDWYWLHSDAYGQVLAENVFGAEMDRESAQLLLPTPGGWRLWGNHQGTTDSIAFAEVDAAGNLLANSRVLDGLLYGGKAASDGSTLLCGKKTSTKALFAKMDAAGQLLWAFSDSLGHSTRGLDAAFLPNGDIWLLGDYLRNDTVPNVDIFLLKSDAGGQITETIAFEWPDNEIPAAIVQQAADRWIIAGSVFQSSNAAYLDEDLLLVAVNVAGDTVWRRHYPMAGYQQVHSAIVLSDGHIVLAGETRASITGSRDAFLAKTDGSGNLLWYRTYGGIRGDIFWDVKAMPDGGFALAGQTASFGDTALKAWLLRTDAAGNLWSNLITGKVTFDEVLNCQPDAQELPLANFLVAAAGAAGIYYASTAADGTYEIPIDTGAWYVSVLPPSGYWNACSDSIAYYLTDFGETVLLDLPVQATYSCPLMQVDLATPYLRRCFENTYTVTYRNLGTASAENARIAVVPDSYLTPTGASLPYLLAGDTLLFDIGTVLPLQSGSFVFQVLLDCDSTVLGQTHCSEAFIYPDSLCYAIDPAWDGAVLEVSGYCAGDSVVLQVANSGSAMLNPVAYVITEDQVIFRQAQLFLGAGQDTTFVLYPNGATVTLMVQQTEGFPGNTTPTLVIEGCGGFPFSTGYALQFPTDDGDPYYDMECRTSIGSFDPNEKTGLPFGVADAGYIAAGTAIEYLIRFQNTGSDTAFRVEIRDTLPPELDLTTLEPGAGSHAYRLETSGSGVLRFVFDPIALPDSFSNVAASQGFVKYRIAAKRSLETGSRIQNRAAIYFDFNTPVMTAYTVHTIGEPLDYLLVDVVEAPLNGNAISRIKASPNPFRESTMLEWPERRNGEPYRVQVYDVLGRLLWETQSREAALYLEMEKMKENILLIRVSQQGEMIAFGKVLRQ